ncbi:MAG TPA: hypothetical protein VI643_00915 [Planctomycetota bacterium]|nr:hypothetical protein [Planctomycetota bacterium]
MADPAASVQCPFCAEFIHPEAIKCKFCKTFLKGEAGLDPKTIETAEQGIAKLTEAAEEPPDLTGQPAKFRISTRIVSALLAANASWLGIVIAMGDGGSPVVVAPILLCIGFGIAWLILFFTDVGCPSPRGRATARAAVLCYLNAVKIRRWKAAFACLSPSARSNPEVEIPEIPEIGSEGGMTTFASPSGLAAYWKSLTHYVGSLGAYRRIARLRIEETSPAAPNVERLRVMISIEHYPQWIILTILLGVIFPIILYFVLRKKWETDFDCVVYKHRSQWWVLTGEIDSPLDRHVFPASEESSGTSAGASTILP